MDAIFFPQREVLRLDSQNLTPSAFDMAAYAGGAFQSNKDGSKALKKIANWNRNPTRVSELAQQAGREMKAEQTARVDAFHQAEAERPLTEKRPVPSMAPENLPQAGVVEMDGGRIRTRDSGGNRGVENPHWREFTAACVVRIQSEPS